VRLRSNSAGWAARCVIGKIKTMDQLTALVLRYPGIVNTPGIITLLGFAIFVFYYGYKGSASYHPAHLNALLKSCFKFGCYLMVCCCLWGCVLLGTQLSLARQSRPINPILASAVGMSWLLIIVPCLFANTPKRRQKGKPAK